MGEKYKEWKRDLAVRPLLAEHHLIKARRELVNALEVVVDKSLRTSRALDMPKGKAIELLRAHMQLADEPFRRFVESMRDRTIRRNR